MKRWQWPVHRGSGSGHYYVPRKVYNVRNWKLQHLLMYECLYNTLGTLMFFWSSNHGSLVDKPAHPSGLPKTYRFNKRSYMYARALMIFILFSFEF